MSCPNWKALGPRGAEDSPAWRAALEHLDGCRECRDAALSVEPTLLFRRLPTVEVPDSEIAAMKVAVRNLRRAEAIEHRPRRRPLRISKRWLRAAALAAMVLGGSLFLRGGGGLVEPPVVAAGDDRAAMATLALDLSHLPLIEDVDASLGSVIQVVDDDLAMVVVEVREKSDV